MLKNECYKEQLLSELTAISPGHTRLVKGRLMSKMVLTWDTCRIVF